jgi:molecular chaperone DnaJ
MNPYEVLGLDRGATVDDIRRAHRKLVREHHPDKGGDAEKFKKVQEAYEILSDPGKRENFDRFGATEAPPQMPDFFSQMFGGGHRGPVKRANFEHEVKISLEEAYRGTVRNLRVTLDKTCFTCRKTCPQCQGRGQISHHMGPMVFNQTCGLCAGDGGRSVGCAECQGGRKREALNLELKIPAGVEDGNTLTGHGLGEQPKTPKEEPGDVIFHIKIQQHPELFRQGRDLVFQTRISFEDSVNGKEIMVPHFDGPIKVNTSDWGVLDPREDYIIPGKGFVDGGRLRVSFNIVYPHAKAKFQISRVS